MTAAEPSPRVAVVGGGIAGLAAAYFLRDLGAGVTVLESSPRVGGKLAVSEVAGIAVDAGAEALLARRPEGVGVIGELGLDGQLVFPGTTSASIWSRGIFRSLPRRQFMGIPGDIGELGRTRILSAPGLERAYEDATLPATPWAGDVAVADLVAARFGAEVVDRLVEPLLGGVYAGRADQLSFQATLTGLAEVSRQHRSLAEAVNAVLGPPREPAAGSPGRLPGHQAGQYPSQPPSPPPVFTTLAAGLGTLPEAVAGASGATVRTNATVRELARTPTGWRLTIGPAIAPGYVDADAVILALPARPASRLLAPVTAAAAAALAEIEYASMAIVTLAFPVAAFPEPVTGSGYLVPAVDGRAVKAVTFSTVKWPHLLSDQAGRQAKGRPVHLVRCSLGRIGEEAVLQREDAELARLAAADLEAATGVKGQPADVRVTRWGGALPQYAVGHVGRIGRIRSAVAAEPGMAICGAAFDGVGIPACIASARLAADQVRAYLSHAGE